MRLEVVVEEVGQSSPLVDTVVRWLQAPVPVAAALMVELQRRTPESLRVPVVLAVALTIEG